MEKYFITRTYLEGEIIYVASEIKGYQFKPKNNIDYGFKIDEVTIIKGSLVEKVIKRKIKNKLDIYLQFLIEQLEDDSSDDSRVALDDLQRYRVIIKKRYSNYLDEKYLELLNQKLDVIEKELKGHIIYNNLEEKAHKSR